MVIDFLVQAFVLFLVVVLVAGFLAGWLNARDDEKLERSYREPNSFSKDLRHAMASPLNSDKFSRDNEALKNLRAQNLRNGNAEAVVKDLLPPSE